MPIQKGFFVYNQGKRVYEKKNQSNSALGSASWSYRTPYNTNRLFLCYGQKK